MQSPGFPKTTPPAACWAASTWLTACLRSSSESRSVKHGSSAALILKFYTGAKSHFKNSKRFSEQIRDVAGKSGLGSGQWCFNMMEIQQQGLTDRDWSKGVIWCIALILWMVRVCVVREWEVTVEVNARKWVKMCVSFAVSAAALPWTPKALSYPPPRCLGSVSILFPTVTKKLRCNFSRTKKRTQKPWRDTKMNKRYFFHVLGVTI